MAHELTEEQMKALQVDKIKTHHVVLLKHGFYHVQSVDINQNCTSKTQHTYQHPTKGTVSVVNIYNSPFSVPKKQWFHTPVSKLYMAANGTTSPNLDRYLSTF